jgi:hypothetical protein
MAYGKTRVLCEYQGMHFEGVYSFDDGREAGYEDFEPTDVFCDGVRLPDIAAEWITNKIHHSELTRCAGRAHDAIRSKTIMEGL